MGRDAFGSKKAVAKTIFGLTGLTNLYKAGHGVYQACQSSDSWQRQKGLIAQPCEQFIVMMDQVVGAIEQQEQSGIEITIARKTLFMRHKTMTLADVAAKYTDKRNAMVAAIEHWRNKHSTQGLEALAPGGLGQQADMSLWEELPMGDD